MELEGVVFDWGGTLTLPIEVIYEVDTWSDAARLLSPDRVDELVERLAQIEAELWELSRTSQKSGRLSRLLASAVEEMGLEITEAVLEEAVLLHLGALTPHIQHDPHAVEVLSGLKERGLRIALLSNTLWPASFHDDFLHRDGLHDLLDARLYTSHMEVTKPHPEAFGSALRALGIDDPRAAVFVGDRPWDDIYGAQRAGLRTVHRPNPLVPDYAVEADAEIDDLRSLLEVVDRWIAS
ncbi:MAG TPA: HAD family hydrolase [Actinomycetota bacterium]|nr:HAD family hydrolase [Actinomycetota bacterium]